MAEHQGMSCYGRIRTWGCCLTTVLGCGLSLIVLQGIRHARHEARVCNCSCHLKQLGLALLNYHDQFGCFPPAYLADAAGKPMHSWRVLILPIYQPDALKEYRFDEPWNSPANSKLDGRFREHFSCPNAPRHGESSMTNYVVVTGPQTAFPGAKSTSVADIRDGLETTLLIVEIANSDIHWMEPQDLDFDTMSFRINDPERPGIGSHDGHDANVCTGDDLLRRMPESVSPATVRALLTIAGGEPVNGENLFRDVLSVRPEIGSANRKRGVAEQRIQQ